MQEQHKREPVPEPSPDPLDRDVFDPVDPLKPVWSRRDWVHEEALYAALAALEESRKP
jgi:hypothetical protein